MRTRQQIRPGPTRGSAIQRGAFLLLACLAAGAQANNDVILNALDGFQLKEASAFLQASPLAPEAETRYYLEGRLAAGHYRADAAIEIASSCIARYPRSSRCQELLGEGYAMALVAERKALQQLRLAKMAREAWRAALMEDPQNRRARVMLMRYYEIAPALAGGSRRAAKRERTTLIAQQPERTEYFLGMHAWSREDWRDALSHLRTAVSLNPGDAEARYYLALSRIELGVPALDELSALVDDAPQFWEAWFNLGVNALRSSAHAGLGLKALYTFIRGAPAASAKRLANAWYAIGHHHEQEGRSQEALGAYTNALEAKPGHNESGEAVTRLRALDEDSI